MPRTAPTSLQVAPNLAIPLDEFRFSYIRAAGPGGQHVNKSSTAVQLRFDVRASKSLSEPVKRRLVALAGNRLTRDGELIVTAQRFRSREQNRRDALERVAKLVSRACIQPKKRRATKPSRAARQRRVDDKKHRGATKRLRRKPGRLD